MALNGVYAKSTVTATPSIMSAATALASNTRRIGWRIQNLDTDPLFVRLGSGCTTSVFDMVLAAGTGADNGTGGSYSEVGGVVYTGIITTAGTTPRYTVSEYYEV